MNHNAGPRVKPHMYKIIGCFMVGVLGTLVQPALQNEAQAGGDRCESWISYAHPVTMSSCSYANGGSGYYSIENRGTSAAKICWTVVANDGKRHRGCYLELAAGAKSEGSCFSCGANNGGTRSIELEVYEPVR